MYEKDGSVNISKNLAIDPKIIRALKLIARMPKLKLFTALIIICI